MSDLTDRLAIVRQKLESLSSELGQLKGFAEDEGATEAYPDIEEAQDAVDGACQSLRAAEQYATPIDEAA